MHSNRYRATVGDRRCTEVQTTAVSLSTRRSGHAQRAQLREQ
ncbi:hypothetical protein [Comamonas sp.]